MWRTGTNTTRYASAKARFLQSQRADLPEKFVEELSRSGKRGHVARIFDGYECFVRCHYHVRNIWVGLDGPLRHLVDLLACPMLVVGANGFNSFDALCVTGFA
jgi:hypothetical protein